VDQAVFRAVGKKLVIFDGKLRLRSRPTVELLVDLESSTQEGLFVLPQYVAAAEALLHEVLYFGQEKSNEELVKRLVRSCQGTFLPRVCREAKNPAEHLEHYLPSFVWSVSVRDEFREDLDSGPSGSLDCPNIVAGLQAMNAAAKYGLEESRSVAEI
jgi:hypothetical protein